MEVTSDLTLYASWSRNRDGTAGSGNSSGYAIDEDFFEGGGGTPGGAGKGAGGGGAGAQLIGGG